MTLEMPRRRRSLLGVALALLALVAAIVLLTSDPRLLVGFSSDREGQALLPVSTLGPGQAAAGRLVLANEGLLPLTYTLQVTGGGDQAQAPIKMHVRRTDQSFFLYQGPPPRTPVTLGRLRPGEHVQLEVAVIAPRSEVSYSTPVDYTFTWTARSPGFSAWWWLIPIALVLALAAFVMPRLYVRWVRLASGRIEKPDRYWRLPLILAVLLLAALIPLLGVSLSAVNASAQNPGNVFARGQLVLSDRTPSGRTCLSVSGSQANPVGNKCDAIFTFNQKGPGDPGVAQLTLQNVGSGSSGRLELWTDGCSTSDAPGEKFHGTGDICGLVQLSIHDDNHNVCYFPAQSAGPCQFGTAGTLGSFATTYTSQHRLQLSPDGLGGGVGYSFAVQLDPAAGNSAQGRQSLVNFNWEIRS